MRRAVLTPPAQGRGLTAKLRFAPTPPAQGRGLTAKLRFARWIAALALCAGVAACARPAPPIAVNAYCEIKATERLRMSDPGLRGLAPDNKRAALAGDDNWKRECAAAADSARLGDRAKSLGPR